MQSEEAMRSLVYQLMSVGRDVRSTSMSWPYERKKLDACVKHLSWRPPWVVPLDEGEADPATCYLDENSVVPDRLGLGRIPAVWLTLNPKYNAAYDIQRLNADAMGCS